MQRVLLRLTWSSAMSFGELRYQLNKLALLCADKEACAAAPFPWQMNCTQAELLVGWFGPAEDGVYADEQKRKI